MTQRFGDRSNFAVEIGEALTAGLRRVDLWAAGQLLTTYDNVAYGPSLIRHMRADADRVRRGRIQPCPFPQQSPEQIFGHLEADQTEFRERYWFMAWDEIVDNLSRYAYLDGDLVIVFAFLGADRSVPQNLRKVFVARIPPQEFVATTHQAADLLDAGLAG